MPRNRTARLAVLAERAPSSPYPSRTASALRRRAAVVGLVVVSLVLITVYFRESDSGGLHGLQGAGATVLRPFEIGAERVSRPFRDAYGYFAGLVHAKSEAARLRRQNAALLAERIDYNTLLQENQDLRRIVHYRARPSFPHGYRAVSTEVTAQPPSAFDQQIVIGAGTSSGVTKLSPVVDPLGRLVGTVTLVFSHTARVTLISDETSAVSAIDFQSPKATGILKNSRGEGQTLVLDGVSKDQLVKVGDLITTAGWRKGRLESLYPKGVPIGRVSSAGNYDTDLFKRVQVKPLADLSGLQSVAVLVQKGAGSAR